MCLALCARVLSSLLSSSRQIFQREEGRILFGEISQCEPGRKLLCLPSQLASVHYSGIVAKYTQIGKK